MSKGILAAVIVAVVASVALAEIGEPIVIGKGRDPQWSPDESHIAFLQGDRLMIKRLDSPEEARHLYTGPILRYYWQDDSTLVAQERRTEQTKAAHTMVSKVTRIPMSGPANVLVYDSVDIAKSDARYLRLQRFPDGGVGYFDGDDSRDAVVALNDQARAKSQQEKPNLYVASVPGPWGQVWLCYGSGENRRQVTPGESEYLIPRLAPSQNRFYCSDSRSNLVIFDTLGNRLATLSDTDMERWGPTSEYIIFCKTRYSHYDLEEADIWIVRSDGTGLRQITNTPDVIEYEPSFSPSGRHIIYRAYGSGEIHLIDIS